MKVSIKFSAGSLFYDSKTGKWEAEEAESEEAKAILSLAAVHANYLVRRIGVSPADGDPVRFFAHRIATDLGGEVITPPLPESDYQEGLVH